MPGSDEADDNRLAGRTPRPPRREPNPEPAELVDDEAEDLPDDTEIEAVTKLMGFLRSDEV